MSVHEGDKRVLCVGLCCVDIISILNSFPQEDTDQRSLDYYWQKGGNSANTSSVLAMLGTNVEFMGTFVKSQEYEFLKKDFASYGVHIENSVVHEEGIYRSPVAIVLINQENGSRTIMAALNHLAEISFEEFDDNIRLVNYKWVHFEGRNNISDIRKMMEKIADYNTTLPEVDRIKVSLELEKPLRTELESLLPLVGVVFISKEYAHHNGFTSKEQVVEEYYTRCNERSTVICAWGEEGAAGRAVNTGTVTSPIFPPERLVDTLGAGDTFIAATIDALSKGRVLKEAITFGCRVAGAKCGMTSNRDLVQFRNASCC